MTAFYICAILLAPMLFMGTIPSAHAQDTEPAKDTSISGPGTFERGAAESFDESKGGS